MDHNKRATFVLDSNSDISRAIFKNSAPVKMEINILQFANWLAWWPLTHITMHVTKLLLWQYYPRFETTVADCFLECLQSKRLFATNFWLLQFSLGNSFVSLHAENLSYFHSSRPKFYLGYSVLYLLYEAKFHNMRCDAVMTSSSH